MPQDHFETKITKIAWAIFEKTQFWMYKFSFMRVQWNRPIFRSIIFNGSLLFGTTYFYENNLKVESYWLKKFILVSKKEVTFTCDAQKFIYFRKRETKENG